MKRAQIPGNNPLGCFLIAVVIWCAAGPSASAEDFVRVRADQIKPLMSGMAIETPSRNNNTLTYTFRPDGRLDGEVDHGAADEGKWWTTAEGLLCRQWESWGGGDRNCVVLSLGDNSIELLRSDGTPIHRIWEITNKGPRTAQIIAGRRTAGSRQQTADAQPAASPTPAADGEFVRVPADRAKPFMSGMTIATESRGHPMRWTFRPDGKLDGQLDTQYGSTKNDEGNWWTTATGTLCYQWNKWGQARRRCGALSVSGDRIRRLRRDGSPINKIWKITDKGPRTAQIIAGLQSGAPRQQRARRRPRPMAPRKVIAADATPPVIEAPAKLSTDSPTVEIKGRVRDASQIVELSVNGREIAVSGDGAFSFSRGFPTGTSRLMVVAVDEWGNRGQKEITVTRKAQRVARTRSVRAVDNKAPTIELPPSLETKSAAVAINGRVTDASQIIEVTVNGRSIPVQKNGSFTLNRGVPTGTSNIVVAAVDEWGNRAERRITVRRAAAPLPVQNAVDAPRARPKAKKQVDPFAGIHFGAYHALVIGNNKYQHLQKLKSARNDAKAVTRLLADQYGFKVTQLADATRSDILGTLAKYRASLKPDDNLLIYYAGHGVVDNVTEQGYWLPVDAEEQNPSNWISNSDLTSMLRAIRARHVMVVADSCYSGTLVRAASAKLKTAREKVQWIKRMLTKRGRTALVSGGLEPVTDSGGGNHSVFANAFLSALNENRDVLEGRTLFDRIKRPVVLNADQTPRYSDIRRAGHEGGEFVFVRRKK